MSNNINALIDALKDRASQIAGSNLAPPDREVVVELTHVGLELLRQALLDINRCAGALEVLAIDRKTARSGEKWP